MTARACMGGWCAVRENCKYFHVNSPARLSPVERLCEPKTHSFFHPEPHDAFEVLRMLPSIPIEQSA